MVDIRPISVRWPVAVIAAGQTTQAGIVEDTLRLDDIRAANRALQQLVRQRWYDIERIEYFDYRWYWDTLAEMVAYLDERWYARLRVSQMTFARVETLLAAADSGAQICLSRRMVIGRYAKQTLNRALPPQR